MVGRGEHILGEFLDCLDGLEAYFTLDERAVDVLTALEGRLKALISQKGASRDTTADVHPTAIVQDSWIGRGAVVHDFANVRDSWIGEGCIIGHCCEVVSSVLVKNCRLSRFTYVGRSILGRGVWVGACVGLSTHILSQPKPNPSTEGKLTPTRDRKLGSIIGDRTQICFGAHVYPVTMIGHDCEILSHSLVRGAIPSDSLVIQTRQQQIVERKNWLRIRSLLEY